MIPAVRRTVDRRAERRRAAAQRMQMTYRALREEGGSLGKHGFPRVSLGRASGGTLATVAQLDGTWSVKRLGGLLPPLAGMRKRIDGTRGETLVGPLHMSFEVRGNELHYRRPLNGFVDVVEAAEPDRFRGRATFHGREFGRFELRRIDV